MKGRFVKGEAVISTDPRTSYDYAKKVLRTPFEECEKNIWKNSQVLYLYCRYVKRKPLIDYHNEIFNSNNVSRYKRYIEFLKKHKKFNMNEIAEHFI